MTAAANALLESDDTDLDISELEQASAEEVLAWTYERFERVALVASFQMESGVLIDMACRVVGEPEVLTIDTGRLPEETHTIIERFRRRYPIRLRVLSPDADDVDTMTAEHGTNLFRESVDLRLRCCDVRKVRPLARALAGYDAWVTGVRREQAPSRGGTPVIAADPAHDGIMKVAPLAGWSRDRVFRYLEQHNIPQHPLYARGYTSIGCTSCTRATLPGESERAGRWWWERDGSTKECGLHPVTVVHDPV